MIKQNFSFKSTYRCNGLIALWCFFIIGWSTSVYAEQDLQEEVVLVETTQFELLGTNNGKLHLTIKAYEMRQYESGNVTLAGNIEVVIFGNKTNKEESLTHIQANRLHYNKEKNICMIEGNVLLSKPQEQLTLHTEQLWYDIKQEIIFTELPIVIAHKENILKGSGLRATKDLTKYMVTGPNGTVDIKQEAILSS